MITYSVEKLYHFKCTKCNKWWTIGDFHVMQIKMLTCPFCMHDSMPVEIVADS